VKVVALPTAAATAPKAYGDFVFRFLFFSLAPFGIVIVAELFPVRGALADVGLALAVFALGEAGRRWAHRWRAVGWALSTALRFESYYRERPPRSFAYYVFYPLLFPYWLANREARHEFLVFRGYTMGGFVVLLISMVWQYVGYFEPELGLREFLPWMLVVLTAEMLLVLGLLMPIATTVVLYHSSARRSRLLVLLAAGLLSTALSIARVARRRDPVVSYGARERVALRTAVHPERAHQALLAGVRAAWGANETPRAEGPAQPRTPEARPDEMPAVQDDGKVEGEPLDRAHDALESYYKHDEAHAFDLWASPRVGPQVLVVYFEERHGRPPIWAAVRADASEIVSTDELPAGALRAMRRAADGTAPLLPWRRLLRLTPKGPRPERTP
jgi:hypothetical protein